MHELFCDHSYLGEPDPPARWLMEVTVGKATGCPIYLCDGCAQIARVEEPDARLIPIERGRLAVVGEQKEVIILNALKQAPGSTTTELADGLARSRAYVDKTLRALKRKGLVERQWRSYEGKGSGAYRYRVVADWREADEVKPESGPRVGKQTKAILGVMADGGVYTAQQIADSLGLCVRSVYYALNRCERVMRCTETNPYTYQLVGHRRAGEK